MLILFSDSCGVEEDKGTASAVPDTNDSTRCVWVGIGRSEPVAAGPLRPIPTQTLPVESFVSGTADAVPLSSSTPQLPLSSINNLLRKSVVE